MQNSHTANRSRRGAFTLVELLVAISILVILVTITAASMNWTAQQDRIPNGANEVASFIMGARDRAIFRRSPTGVRLVLNQDGPTNVLGNPITVSSMMYIGSPEELTGAVSIEFLSNASDPNHLRKLRFVAPGGDNRPGDMGNYTNEFDPSDPNTRDYYLTREFNDFARLSQLGLLDTGVQISIRAGGSLKQNFTLVKAGNGMGLGPDGYDWLLSADYTAGNVGACMNLEFTVKPLPAILPNQEPRDLPRGVVIDLESSRRQNSLPRGWYFDTDQRYMNFMDIMFSPRGTGFGQSAASGLIHLVLTESADVERTSYDDSSGTQLFYQLGKPLEERPNAGQERIVTINPSSGKVSVSPLLLDDGNSDSIPDDPFKYGEVGKSAP